MNQENIPKQVANTAMPNVADANTRHGSQPVTPSAPPTPTPPPQASTLPSPESLVLPHQVVSRGDVSKSLRELEAIDDYFHQAAIRGSKDQAIPALGRALDGLANVNNLNMLRPEDRQVLKVFLSRLKARAPVVHISLPSEASGSFMSKILDWFRTEVHPHTVISVGLRPDLVAGCMVRTTNKTFDFSFKRRFEASKEKLVQAIGASSGGADDVVQPQSVPQESAQPSIEPTEYSNQSVESVQPQAQPPKGGVQL